MDGKSRDDCKQFASNWLHCRASIIKESKGLFNLTTKRKILEVNRRTTERKHEYDQEEKHNTRTDMRAEIRGRNIIKKHKNRQASHNGYTSNFLQNWIKTVAHSATPPPVVT